MTRHLRAFLPWLLLAVGPAVAVSKDGGRPTEEASTLPGIGPEAPSVPALDKSAGIDGEEKSPPQVRKPRRKRARPKAKAAVRRAKTEQKPEAAVKLAPPKQDDPFPGVPWTPFAPENP